MPLDEVDRKIISQLQIDGRTSYKKLSELVGYTPMGVKKRLKKLIDKGIVKISALLNLRELNLSAAVVLLEMESSEAMKRVLRRFKECPRVIQIYTTLGGYNMIALVVAEDQKTLESISVEKCSIRSGKGIRRSEFYPIGNIYYSPFMPIREHLAHKGRTITPCNVNCEPCERYRLNLCVGCPATIYYRGSL